MAQSVMDFILASCAAEKDRLTYDEWCAIRHTNDPDKIREAVEKMEAQGGYDNLD